MIKFATLFVSASALVAPFALISPANAGVNTHQLVPGPSPQLDYPTYAALVIAAPLVIDATVRSTTRITGAEAANVAPGHVRYYVTADLTALIRGNAALPARIGYLVDLPFDTRGRAPRINRLRVLLFARPVPNRPDMVQLIAAEAQRDWSPEADSLVRAIARDALSPGAPPEITGVGNAFHTPGDLPGDGETQIFLLTANHDPISLSIRRRADGRRSWAVSLGEIVDDAARPPARDTLLWYRLACGLPRDLPPGNVAADMPEHARIVREDYALVVDSLGTCGSAPDRWNG